MQTKTTINFALTKQKLMKAGYHVTGWSVANGLSPNTVKWILYGKYPSPGSPRMLEVIDLLRKGGFLVEEVVEVEEINSIDETPVI